MKNLEFGRECPSISRETDRKGLGIWRKVCSIKISDSYYPSKNYFTYLDPVVFPGPLPRKVSSVKSIAPHREIMPMRFEMPAEEFGRARLKAQEAPKGTIKKERLTQHLLKERREETQRALQRPATLHNKPQSWRMLFRNVESWRSFRGWYE